MVKNFTAFQNGLVAPIMDKYSTLSFFYDSYLGRYKLVTTLISEDGTDWNVGH